MGWGVTLQKQSLIRYPKIIGNPIVYISNCFLFLHINIIFLLKLNDYQCKFNTFRHLSFLLHALHFFKTLFSAKLASNEVKLLEDVVNCHLRAQLNERNNKYCLLT